MGGEQIFQVVPAEVRTWWINVLFVVLAVSLLAVMVFVRHMVENVSKASFAVDGRTLEIRAWPYGRRVALSDLDLGGARVVDLTREREIGLKWKTNGVNMSGLRGGWWRLRNGQKALVFVTDMTRAVYLPTREGYALVMSVADPDRFLAALGARPGA